MSRPPRLAAFVSPHGFGHAARTCAVVEALARRLPELEVDLYTKVPAWFFAESLSIPFTHHELACDLGLVQRNALDEDPVATAAALARIWPPAPALVASLATALARREVRLVLCDMAPLGLVVARAAALPVALVESFTWRFIYEGYRDEAPALAAFGTAFDRELATATWRFRAEPFCGDEPGVPVGPIAREPRSTREAVRARLALRPAQPVVLVSMGGIPWSFAPASLARLADAFPGGEQPLFVVPGGAERQQREGDLLLLPHHSPIHHPDLVSAADLVVGKLGYSTVVEAVRAGARFAYLPRPRFRESPVLAAWLDARTPTCELAAEALADGSWSRSLAQLLATPSGTPGSANGAAAVAEALAEVLAGAPR